MDQDYLAVCESICRVNHGCRPNCRYYWDYTNFCVGLVTTRFVKAEEDLTICYIDPLLPAHERQKLLCKTYGFKCNCESPTEAEDEAYQFTKKGACTKAYLQRVLEMLGVEGLQAERPEILAQFARFEHEHGHKERANKLAKWALKELGRLECEDATSHWDDMRQILST